MIGPDLSRVEIFIRPGGTDMRKQINGLSMIATEHMEQDPLSGALFLFCNKHRRILKALYWDATGFALWMKKLERDRFPWPQTEEAARRISAGELQRGCGRFLGLVLRCFSDGLAVFNRTQTPEG